MWGLGDGGYAEWTAVGGGLLDPSGGNPVSDILIHGRDNAAMSVKVEVVAFIGSLSRTIYQEELNVDTGEDIVIPLDVTPALGLHEKQYAYPTLINARVTEIPPAGKFGHGQSLEQLYLVARPEGTPHEIYDFESFAKAYPRGVTTSEELVRMEALIAKDPTGEGANEQFIASGVHTTIFE